jgi:aromatic-L-amino-acid decarboxylase
MWLHVDAAYGGFFRLTARGMERLAAMDRADSVTLDPHKGLFLPYGTGCLVVRDRTTLKRAHAMTASYLPPMQSDDDLVDFCELSPELSREARGVRVWLPLKMHGVGAFREALDEKLDLARWLASEIAAIANVEMIDGPELSLFAFRIVPADRARSESELDEWNRSVLSGVNARQRVHITGAVVRGRYVLRVCVLSFRTHQVHADALLQDLRASIDDASRPKHPPL